MILIMNNEALYIPDHLRITGVKKRKEPRKNRSKDTEMIEIRKLEDAGIIPVDKFTEASVKLDESRRQLKRRKRALGKNRT